MRWNNIFTSCARPPAAALQLTCVLWQCVHSCLLMLLQSPSRLLTIGAASWREHQPRSHQSSQQSLQHSTAQHGTAQHEKASTDTVKEAGWGTALLGHRPTLDAPIQRNTLGRRKLEHMSLLAVQMRRLLTATLPCCRATPCDIGPVAHLVAPLLLRPQCCPAPSRHRPAG
jgi:hypothetical protein